MSHLVQMRQRIKAIETIKKITSAMRLISRSFHTRMHKNQDNLAEYRNVLCEIFTELRAVHPEWKPNKFFPSSKLEKKELLIIIGSQKGLCGNFNSNLFYWIDTHKDELKNTELMVFSKKIEEHLAKHNLTNITSEKELKPNNLDEATENLINHIFENNHNYTKVTILSNQPKTFFVHEQKLLQVIPFVECTTPASEHLSDDYLWNHDSDTLLTMLAHNYLRVVIRTALFESLLGEQAARFISMDNATRNANKFLDSMQLQYNKARQAKITKELTELAGAFESESFN